MLRNDIEQHFNEMAENIIQNATNMGCLNRKEEKHQIITIKNVNGQETRKIQSKTKKFYEGI